MCHFLAPVGQPEMMHKNFMRRHLRISVVRCSGMKFFAHFQLNTPQIMPLVSLRNQRLFAAFLLGKGRHDRQPQLTIAVHCPDILLDEIIFNYAAFSLQTSQNYGKMGG
jgi:hypothetical protein